MCLSQSKAPFSPVMRCECPDFRNQWSNCEFPAMPHSWEHTSRLHVCAHTPAAPPHHMGTYLPQHQEPQSTLHIPSCSALIIGGPACSRTLINLWLHVPPVPCHRCLTTFTHSQSSHDPGPTFPLISLLTCPSLMAILLSLLCCEVLCLPRIYFSANSWFMNFALNFLLVLPALWYSCLQ